MHQRPNAFNGMPEDLLTRAQAAAALMGAGVEQQDAFSICALPQVPTGPSPFVFHGEVIAVDGLKVTVVQEPNSLGELIVGHRLNMGVEGHLSRAVPLDPIDGYPTQASA